MKTAHIRTPILALAAYTLCATTIATAAAYQNIYGEKKESRAASIIEAPDGGLIVTGWTTDFGVKTQDEIILKTTPGGELDWVKTFGGDKADHALTIQHTPGGGYFIGGITTTNSSKHSSTQKYFILNLDRNGATLQDIREGILKSHDIADIRRASDGTYITVGNTNTYTPYDNQPTFAYNTNPSPFQSPFLSPFTPTITTPPFTYQTYPQSYITPTINGEIYITKLGPDGKTLWFEKCCANNTDTATSITPTNDGSFILAGQTQTYPTQGKDILVVKMNKDGGKEWEKNFGRQYDDKALDIQPTLDGGCIIAGYIGGFNTIGNDALLLKLDPLGNKQWETTFGGKMNDMAYTVTQTRDMGYIAAGVTESYGRGRTDILIAKFRHNGDIEWQTNIGGKKDDTATDIIQTSDGGYAIAGTTKSFGVKGTAIYIIKLDQNGLTGPEPGTNK